MIPWEEHTYVGTTDTDYDGPLDDPTCTDDEAAYLLDALNGVTTVKATSADIVGSWAGLRPLLSSARHARSADLSRRHGVHVAPSGVVTVTGGKLTTYRRMAADAVDAAVRVLDHHVPRSATKHLRLLGSDGVDRDTAERDHLIGRFGAEAAAIQALVDADPALGEPLVPGLEYLRAEAVYAARHEMAHTLDDVLSRRTRARVLARDASIDAASAVADLIAPELGWSADERAREVCDYRQAAARGTRVTRPRALAVALSVLTAVTVITTAMVAPGSARAKKPAPTTTRPRPDHHDLGAAPRVRHQRRVGRLRQRLRVRHPHRARSTGGDRRRTPSPLALIRRPASVARRAHRRARREPGRSGLRRHSLPPLARLHGCPQVVQDRFDVVSWDPRGTGSSRPIDCVDDAYLDLGAVTAPVPDTRGDARRVSHAYNARFAAGCAERIGTYAGQVGTRNIARDLEAIRIALGEPKLNYLGFSYGTVVGATYAQMFPTTIRTHGARRSARLLAAARSTTRTRRPQAFMKALDAFLDWCEQTRRARSRPPGAPRDVLQPADRPRRRSSRCRPVHRATA